MSRHTLDTRNLLCPLPVIRAQNRVAELAPGDTLEVHATDPGAMHDIPSWARMHGHEVMESRIEGREVIVTVRVGPKT
jgi:tRNA 2-thiouridine synthesizing protein A